MEQEFTRWAHARQQPLLRTAVLLCGDHHRAEDLVQDALTKVALRWPRLRDGHPDAYARQVMVRTNISWWRRHRREVVLDLEDRVHDSAGSPGPGADVDRRLLLDHALAQLTARQRTTVVLRFYEDLSERETAEAMGVGLGTVKSQTHVALARLRAAAPELAELLEEPTT